MSVKVIIVLWDACGACHQFKAIWPRYKQELDKAYGKEVTYAVHTMTSGRGFSPPLDGPLSNMNVIVFPTLVVLGPNEQSSNYKIDRSNIQRDRTINNGIIVPGGSQADDILSWLKATINTKLGSVPQSSSKQNPLSTASRQYNGVPPNKTYVNPYGSNFNVISGNSLPPL